MARKNKLFNIIVLTSLFSFSLSSCQTSSPNVIVTQPIDLTGVEFDNISETVTYDGYPHSIFAKNVPEGVTVTYENNGAIEIGTHKIIAHFTKRTSGSSSSVRYEEATQIATLNIVKDATNVSETLSEKLNKLKMDDMEVTYNGAPYTTVLNDSTLIPSGFKAIYGNNVHTNAGEYSVTCKIVNIDTMVSYKTLYSKMTIKKAEIDIKDVKFDNVTYPSDGQMHTIEATNLPDKVAVRYELVKSNITDSLEANALTNVGYKDVKAIFTIDATSQIARSNYVIVNSSETDRTKNYKNARIEILAAGSVVFNIKYRVVQYEETYDPNQNLVTSRTKKYVLDDSGNPAIYSQTTLNTSYGNYISTSSLIAREGYKFEIADNTYSNILTESGYLIPENSKGGDIIVDYVPEIYNVNFSGSNISLNSRDYTSVEQFDLITPQVDDGYRFVGWYSDSSYSIPITSLRGLTGDRTIYGRAILDEKIGNGFAAKDTFATWDGTGKSIEVFGTAPTDVKVKYFYYKVDSAGNKTLINGVDENRRPSEVGKYAVTVSFFKISDSGKVTDEKRYNDINVYLVIEPAKATSVSSNFESTSFTWTGDRNTGNYPKLTNYPQNAKNITYEYFDSNMTSLGKGDTNRPTEPGKYHIKGSYTIENGTDEGELKEYWTEFTITKKSYAIEFTNKIKSLFPDYSYEIKRGTGKVKLTRSDGYVLDDIDLSKFADTGFIAELAIKDENGNIKTDLGIDTVKSIINNGDGTYTITFENDSTGKEAYAKLNIHYSMNSIKNTDVGQITAMLYFDFVDEDSANHFNLPESQYSTLLAFTSGESTVQFKNSDGELISTISVATGNSVPAPSNIEDYLPAGINLNEYEAKWVSDNLFSTLSHIVCDTTFTLNFTEKKFKITFAIDNDSKGTVSILPNQIFTISTSTVFSNFSPTVEKGYHLGAYYVLTKDGKTFNITNSDTLAQASRKYNNSVNGNNYCTDMVVYIRTIPYQTVSIFDSNGGTLQTGNSIQQTFGQTFVFPTDPIAPTGSTFLGWQLNGVMVAKNTKYVDYAETLTFIAQYSSPQNTITFLPENGDSYTTYAISYNEVIPIPSITPTKAGYIFKGWYLNGEKLVEGTIFSGEKSLVYIAQYDVISVDIIYHNKVIHSVIDDEEADILVKKQAKYGDKIPNPTTEAGSILYPPTINGYEFSGWSLDGVNLLNSDHTVSNLSQKIIDGVISYYIDIYPVYKNNNYKITYAFNVESLLNKVTNVIFNEIVNAEQTPNRIGYYFDGWYTTSTFDQGTNFFEDILKNPAEGIVADCYPYEKDIVLYAKWIRKEYMVTFRYIPDINNPTKYVDYPANGLKVAYGQLLTSATTNRTWITEDEIYSTNGQGLGLTRDVTPIFTYRNGSTVSEGQAFLYDPATYELEEDLKNKEYDKNNIENNKAIIYINSTINNYFNVSYIADEYGLPVIQSVIGNSNFTLNNHPVREGKKWIAYYYYYTENNQSKKYYLTSDGTKNGTPLTTWNLSDSVRAKNGITNYVLYSEFDSLRYRIFVRSNDQSSLLPKTTWGGVEKEGYVQTEYGQPYAIFTDELKERFSKILAEKGYKFSYWRDNFGRIITSNTVLTDPKATDIESSYAYKADGSIDYDKSNYDAGIYLYAQVTPLTYNMTFLPDNNTNPYVINVGYNQVYSKMGDPQKDGYKFIGWKYFDANTFDIDKYRDGTLDPDCALKDGEMSEVSYNQTRDIIAVAQYQGDSYTITYKYNIFKVTDTGYSFNTDYKDSTITENITYKEAYTLKDFTQFTNLNEYYKYYLALYDFVGWLDEANQVTYQPGTHFDEYNKSASTSYVAIYQPKQFTVEFLYQTIDNSSLSSLTSTKKVTRIANKEKVTFNDDFKTPIDPIPDDISIYGGNKTWLARGNTKGDVIALNQTYTVSLNFIKQYFYNDSYAAFHTAIKNLVDEPAVYGNNFRTLVFDLNADTSIGYYNIYLNNKDIIKGNTYYDVYGNPESGDENVLLEKGNRIKLPNINLTISNGLSFIYRYPDKKTETNSISFLDTANDGGGNPYVYTVNGVTYKPFLRTVYVINGDYYLDGDISPMAITGTASNPTKIYAFTTYVSGSYISSGSSNPSSYTELYNFTLKDEDGVYLKSYIPSKKGAVVDGDKTLDSKNEIAFAGFMNKRYTSVGTTYDSSMNFRPVLIPYFYYDGLKIRKVTTIAHDQSGLGAFENSNYATNYFLPSTISYIASNSFKNAFSGTDGMSDVKVKYLDTSSYFDYSAVILDSSLTTGSRLQALSSKTDGGAGFNYTGYKKGDYDEHRFFSGRTHLEHIYEAINTYTVLGFINSFTTNQEYQDTSSGPQGKQGDLFYYSSTNPTRISAYFKKLSTALSDASADGVKDDIIAFSQTDDSESKGNIDFSSISNRYQAYPYFLYFGTAINFVRNYSSTSDITSLKITDEQDLPIDATTGEKLYPDSPLYKIDKFYLTLPYQNAKQNTATSVDISELSQLNAVYLNTPNDICTQLYNGTEEGKNYFGTDVNSGDPLLSYQDDNFVTCYLNYGSDASLAYFYNGDDEENGLTGAEYLIQQLIDPNDQTKADKIRENFNKKCYEYTFDSSGSLTSARHTRMLSVKNYKTKSAEYFYLGNYKSFLRNGKDYVDQYAGQTINFLDLTDDQLTNQDEENLLGIIDENTKIQKIYIGTSSKLLASLSTNEIQSRIDDKYIIYTTNSDIDYNITPFFFGTLAQYKEQNKVDPEKYPLTDPSLLQMLRTDDVTDTIKLRDSIFVYIHDATSDNYDTSNLLTEFTTDLYLFDTDNAFYEEDNAYFFYNLTKSNTHKLVYQLRVKKDGTSEDIETIYYTSTAKEFAQSYYSDFKGQIIAVLMYDYNVDINADKTTRTNVNYNEFEALFVGTQDDIGTGDNQITWTGINNLKNNFDAGFVNTYVAYYLSSSTGSTIAYHLTDNFTSNTADKRTKLDYFFNNYDKDKNRYRNLVEYNNVNYYNDNIKTILANVNNLGLNNDLLSYLTSSTIYNALYCFEEGTADNRNSIALSDFKYMYYGTDDQFLNNFKNDNITTRLNLDNLTNFIFVMPNSNYSDTADIDDVTNDDMGLLFAIDSLEQSKLKATASTISLDSNSYLNNKKRFISVIIKTSEKQGDVEATYDVYYYFRGRSDSTEAKALTYSNTANSLNYANKFILYEGDSSTSVDDDFYNYVGTINDILNEKSNPLFRTDNFYNLLTNTEISSTTTTVTNPDGTTSEVTTYGSLKSRKSSIFFAGNARNLEGSSSTLNTSNTQLVDDDLRDTSIYPTKEFYADLVTVLLLDKPTVLTKDEILASNIFKTATYYRASEIEDDYYFDYLYAGYKANIKGTTKENEKTSLVESIVKKAFDNGLNNNEFILFRGNNSKNKGILSFGGKVSSALINPGGEISKAFFGENYDFGVLDLTAKDFELNLAVPVYYSSSNSTKISDTDLLQVYEGYDIISLRDNDDKTKQYAGITYIGDISSFTDTRFVLGPDPTDSTKLIMKRLYEDVTDFNYFSNKLTADSAESYYYNRHSFHMAPIVKTTDDSGNSSISSEDSGFVRTVLFVSQGLANASYFTSTKRENETQLKLYADLFSLGMSNVAPMLLSEANSSKDVGLTFIDPVVYIADYASSNPDKNHSTYITNKLYVGTNQFVDFSTTDRYDSQVAKPSNSIKSMLFNDDISSYLLDSEKVISITSKDEGFLDSASAIGSLRATLGYYVNKYTDKGTDADNPLNAISTSDYTNLYTANFVGSNVESTTIKDFFSSVNENGVLDIIPFVEFKKQEKTTDADGEETTKDISAIAELLSMRNLQGNITTMGLLTDGWFGFAKQRTSSDLLMDGNQVANRWLSSSNPVYTEMIKNNRVYMPLWFKRFTEQEAEGGNVPAIGEDYNGRKYGSSSLPSDIKAETTTLQNYFNLGLVEYEEEKEEENGIPQGYYPQSYTISGYISDKYNKMTLEAFYNDAVTNGTKTSMPAGATAYVEEIREANDLIDGGKIFKIVYDYENSDSTDPQRNITGSDWYLMAEASFTQSTTTSTGMLDNLLPASWKEGDKLFFKFDSIQWETVTSNDTNNPNTNYAIPSKILDAELSRDLNHINNASNLLSKYAIDKPKFKNDFIGGSSSTVKSNITNNTTKTITGFEITADDHDNDGYTNDLFESSVKISLQNTLQDQGYASLENLLSTDGGKPVTAFALFKYLNLYPGSDSDKADLSAFFEDSAGDTIAALANSKSYHDAYVFNKSGDATTACYTRLSTLYDVDTSDATKEQFYSYVKAVSAIGFVLSFVKITLK